MEKQENRSRRSFLKWFGFYTFLAAIAAQFAAIIRFMMPNGLVKPPHVIKLGPPQIYSQGVTLVENAPVFIFRRDHTFYAMSTICTHLGCTVNEIHKDVTNEAPASVEFDCPCHGSRYDENGINMSGPAPKPLPRFRLFLAAEDGQLTVDLQETVQRDFRLIL